MTSFTVGERVCYPAGERAGVILAIIFPMDGPDRIRVLADNGTIYEEEAKRLVYCSGKRSEAK